MGFMLQIGVMPFHLSLYLAISNSLADLTDLTEVQYCALLVLVFIKIK